MYYQLDPNRPTALGYVKRASRDAQKAFGRSAVTATMLHGARNKPRTLIVFGYGKPMSLQQ